MLAAQLWNQGVSTSNPMIVTSLPEIWLQLNSSHDRQVHARASQNHAICHDLWSISPDGWLHAHGRGCQSGRCRSSSAALFPPAFGLHSCGCKVVQGDTVADQSKLQQHRHAMGRYLPCRVKVGIEQT